jgi:iron complex transport system substrate-binding protein
MKQLRVVSLLAGGTEIVCGLGAGRLLVGRSHECDNPSWVTVLPVCSRPAFDVSGPSREIDAEVKRRFRSGEALYVIDTDLIESLRADILIAQTHCDVCAVTPGDIQSAAGDAERRTIALQAGTVDGIYADILSIGQAIGFQREAIRLVAEMKGRIDAVRDAVKDRPTKSVVVLEWIDPVFTSGNWVPELVENANGRLALGERDIHSRPADWSDVQSADPEYLIVAPCGFDLERTIRELPFLEALPGWDELRAVSSGNVALADGNKYFNRSGTTIVETVEVLAEILHGHESGHRGDAWLRLDDVREKTSKS